MNSGNVNSNGKKRQLGGVLSLAGGAASRSDIGATTSSEGGVATREGESEVETAE